MVIPREVLNEIRATFQDSTQPAPPRDSDNELARFLNDQDQGIDLSNLVVKRLMLLDKRRKDHNEHLTTVFGDTEHGLTHLQDSFQIVELVSPEIQKSALVHDIGKTGPANADDETQKIIMALYAEIHDFDIRTTTVLDLLIKIFDEPEKAQMAIDKLREVGITADTTLDKFYPMHVEWGEEILRDEPGLTDQEKFIAFNHHRMWRGKNMSVAGYKPDEKTIKMAHELELADFYQAARVRGGKSSTQAQDLLRKVFVGKIPSDELNTMIDVIASRDKN